MVDALCQHGTWRDRCALCNPTEIPQVTIPRVEYEALRAAALVLKPFAAYADPRRKVPRELPIGYGSPLAKPQLTMGDCYDAVDALHAAGVQMEEK